MGNFKPDRNNRSFGRSDRSDRFDRDKEDRPRRRFGNDRGGSRFGGRSDRRGGRSNEMTSVTCSKCGKRCEVPFKPTGSKPVLCSDCFRQKGDSSDSQGQASSKQMSEINAKLDKILSILSELEIVDDSDEDNEEDEEDLDEDVVEEDEDSEEESE